MKRTPLKRGTKQMKRMAFKPKASNSLKNAPRNRVNTQNRVKGAKSMAKLKKELDAVFSKYIRNIHPPVCYTCGKTDTVLQCGHFVSRQYLATRWDENNCRPQCPGCNLFGNGMPLDFEERLKIELGDQKVEEMKRSRHQVIKLDRPWYIENIAKYKALLAVDN